MERMSRQPGKALAAPNGCTVPLLAQVRIRLASLGINPRALWYEIRRLGEWLEGDVFPAAKSAGRAAAALQANGDDTIQFLAFPGDHGQALLPDCGALCGLLRRLGIGRLVLEPRLSGGQVRDVLTMLHCYRRGLADRGGAVRGGWLGGLFGQGVHLSCTCTRIAGDAVHVEYYFCDERFHLLVRRFERLGRSVGDHRTMFRAAPICGALAGAAALGTFLVFAVYGNWLLMLALTLVEAAALAAGAYVLLMAVGAIEYDNEEKAYRLQRANVEMRHYADRIHEDLSRAKDAQHNLLPDPARMPLADRVEWASSFAPETEVGGDYYDAAGLPGRRAALLLCDVSGHGMGAALITTLVKSAFLAWTDEGRTIGEFILLANSNLCRFTPEGSFAALVAGEYDAQSRTLHYVNAGHSPQPILVPTDPTRPPKYLDARGAMVLGVMPKIDVHVAAAELSAGDSVVLATDGLAEALNVEGKRFGLDRLLDVLAANRGLGLQEMVDALTAEVSRFAEGVEATDDRTVLALRVR